MFKGQSVEKFELKVFMYPNHKNCQHISVNWINFSIPKRNIWTSCGDMSGVCIYFNQTNYLIIFWLVLPTKKNLKDIVKKRMPAEI